MLTYPDRHRFEEIRSQWEAAQVSADNTGQAMGGRRENLAAHPPLNGHEGNNASKFRRKLSQGFSLISLSQRRVTTERPSLPSANSTNVNSAMDDPQTHECTTIQFPVRGPSPSSVSICEVTPNKDIIQKKKSNSDATSKQLPRSRTMSFIPQSNRSGSEPSTVTTGLVPMVRPLLTLEEESCATHTKIPSPSSPAEPYRNARSRQYNSSLTTQQAKHLAAGKAFAGIQEQSPSRFSPVRSYTTPNLLKTSHAQGPGYLRNPRRLNNDNFPDMPGSQGRQGRSLKENNVPITHRHGKRLSNIQERSYQSTSQEDFDASKFASKRRLTGPACALASSKTGSSMTLSASSKNGRSLNASQTHPVAQRALPKEECPHRSAESLAIPKDGTIMQNRLLGPVNLPAPSKADHTVARSGFMGANVNKDFRKRPFPSPHNRMGGGMRARSHALVNNEVRLSRSSTYHRYVNDEVVPPVPPIPEQYKSASMPVLASIANSSTSTTMHPMNTSVQGQFETTSSSPSVNSVLTLPNLPSLDDTQVITSNDKPLSSKSLLSLMIKSKPSSQTPASRRTISASLLFSAKPSGLWSAKKRRTLDGADINRPPQVKEYMPALYWAGRFQSRYDQWRTEAMKIELDPKCHISGPLAHCNVHQEKVAACLIFLQLRELCLSNQAADSLWVSNVLS